MSWNHRVVRSVHRSNVEGDEPDVTFGVHEVYYDEAGTPNGVTQDAVAPMGRTEKELRNELRMFMRALTVPTLEMSDFTRGGKYGRRLPAIPRAARVPAAPTKEQKNG